MKSRHASAASTSTCAGAAASFARVRRLAGAQQRLGRDAGPVRALAADELALDQRDTQAAFGERTRAVLAGRAAADDDDVVVAHVGSSSPDCSATMYAAYQSGQFSSYSPGALLVLAVGGRRTPQRARQVVHRCE